MNGLPTSIRRIVHYVAGMVARTAILVELAEFLCDGRHYHMSPTATGIDYWLDSGTTFNSIRWPLRITTIGVGSPTLSALMAKL